MTSYYKFLCQQLSEGLIFSSDLLSDLESDISIVNKNETMKPETSLLWILIHANSPGLTSLDSRQVLCGSTVWLIFIQSGSVSLHVDFRNSGRSHLCVVLSPLWRVLHYFPTATLEYPQIPSTFLSPPLYRTTLSQYSSSHFSNFFLMQETL